MKMLILRNGLIAVAVAFLFVGTVPLTVSAQSVRAEESRALAQERREAAQTRLSDAKLKACQNREKAVTNIMARIGDRGQRQIDLFAKITDRIERFYEEKGKTLNSYDALVAEVAAKKADAQAAVNQTIASSTEFKCDGENPKGVAAAFKEDSRLQNDALKAYKTAVKNLITEVKRAQTAVAPESVVEESR